MKVNGILEKKDNTEKSPSYNLSKTIILALVGLILLLMPETLNKLVGIIVGVGILLIGLTTLYKYYKEKSGINLFAGILYSVFGVIVMIYPYSVINFAAICLGVYLVIASLAKLQVAISLKDVTSYWVGTLIVGVINLILGFLLIFNPFAGIAITKLAGAFLVAVAVFDIIDIYILQKK